MITHSKFPVYKVINKSTSDLNRFNQYYNLSSDVPLVDVETANSPEDFEFSKLCLVGIFYGNKQIQIPKLITQSIEEYMKIVGKELDNIPQPFFAWNKRFDESVLNNNFKLARIDKSYKFEEISPFEQKNNGTSSITKMNAFNMIGKKAIYEKGKITNNSMYFCIESKEVPKAYFDYLYFNNEDYIRKIITHNQSCLWSEALIYKSRDILLTKLKEQSKLF